MTFIHAADLHLCRSEEEYGFSVLDEIIALAAAEGAGLLLLGGDIFDSWADLEALRGRFRSAVEATPGLRVLVAAGNHDLSGAPKDPERYDFGQRVRWAWSAPMSLEEAGAEFLILPWGCPPPRPDPAADRGRSGAPLVILAHGALPRMNWLGPSEEEATSRRGNLDESSLAALHPSFVAMGHIHEGKLAQVGSASFAYPGSARVWRRGEEGERRVLAVDIGTDGRASARPLGLSRAGRYRREAAELRQDGSLPEEALERLLAKAGASDWLDIRLSGLAAREGPLLSAAEAFRMEACKRVRKLELDCSDVVYLGEDALSEAASAYRRAWESMLGELEGKYGAAAAHRALATGLRRIASARTGASQ